MPTVRTLECDLKTEVDFVPRGADFEMRLENRSRLCAAQSRLLRCDLKSEVELSCRAERTLECDLKIEVDFVPRGADLRCKKQKALSRKPKRIKIRENK
jgi:hypothetical protein